MCTMSLVCRPRLVVLDTAHFASLVADITSNSPQKRDAARRFFPSLLEAGWIPLLCWHHIEELLQHKNDELVDARLRFLRHLPLFAWIRPSDPNAGPGSILDVLRAEVVAAYGNPGASAKKVRDLARDALLSVGSGSDAIPETFNDWRVLRRELEAHEHNSRRVAAISRWRPTDIDNTRIRDWINRPARTPDEVASNLKHARNRLQREIAVRGDKRISDPAGIAAAFMAQVARDGHIVATGRHSSPATQFLINAGLEPEDIDPSATFGETMDLLIFQTRMRIVTEAHGLPWAQLKRRVTRQQLPVMLIEESLRRHAHDQPERKGSDLNDTHLLCLAPYADMTYVDKRTSESVRRVRRKVADFDNLVGDIAKATGYADIAARLSGY